MNSYVLGVHLLDQWILVRRDFKVDAFSPLVLATSVNLRQGMIGTNSQDSHTSPVISHCDRLLILLHLVAHWYRVWTLDATCVDVLVDTDFHSDQRPPTARYDTVPTQSPRSSNPFQDDRVEQYSPPVQPR